MCRVGGEWGLARMRRVQLISRETTEGGGKQKIFSHILYIKLNDIASYRELTQPDRARAGLDRAPTANSGRGPSGSADASVPAWWVSEERISSDFLRNLAIACTTETCRGQHARCIDNDESHLALQNAKKKGATQHNPRQDRI